MSCVKKSGSCPQKYCNGCPYNGWQSATDAKAEIERRNKREMYPAKEVR